MNNDHLEQARISIRYGSKHVDPRLVVLMGLPGSGKSYAADYLHRKHSFTVLSGENITRAIFGTEKCTGAQYQEAYKILHFLAKETLDQGYPVVIDGTNLKYEFRHKIYAVVGPKVKRLLVYLIADDATAFARANQRGEHYNDPKKIASSVSVETFAGFKAQLEPPTEQEHCIQVVSDENMLQKLNEAIEKFIEYGT